MENLWDVLSNYLKDVEKYPTPTQQEILFANPTLAEEEYEADETVKILLED